MAPCTIADNKIGEKRVGRLKEIENEEKRAKRRRKVVVVVVEKSDEI
jgi:hypothetical protein